MVVSRISNLGSVERAREDLHTSRHRVAKPHLLLRDYATKRGVRAAAACLFGHFPQLKEYRSTGLLVSSRPMPAFFMDAI